jgi:hypothetical protein
MTLSTTPSNRIYAEYRTKPKTVQWYNITQSIGDDNLKQAFADIATSYDIDSNSGEQLDVIGRVVVQDRNVNFTIDPGGVQFGDGDAEFGDLDAEFSSIALSGAVTLTDIEYRLFLKSKIQRNNTSATIDEIITAVNTLLSNATVTKLNDNEDMTFDLEITGTLSGTEESLLKSDGFVPTPQGVSYAGFAIV